jgi:hypothetical protein
MAIVDRRGVVVSGTDPAEGADPNPGLAIKTAVALATTANIALAGLPTIDGVATADNDRVLVKNQTDQTENGIYNASSGNWSRARDADGNSEFAPGVQVIVLAGALNAGKTYKLTTASPVVLGTSLIVWELIVYPLSELPFVFDGGGAEIPVGQQCIIPVPFDCVIEASKTFADRAGALVVDIRKSTEAAYPPGSGDSICAAAPPTLASADKAIDTTLTGWTVALAKDDVLVGVVTAATVVRNATVALQVSRN